jgi:hypothetical protein
MEGNQLATVDGIVVPNDYSVYLNPQDMVLYTDFVTSLCRQMEDWLIDLADERNYGFIDQVRVQMFGDDRIEPRTISVDAHIAELPGYDPVQQEAVQRTEVYRVVERTGNVPPQLLRVTSAVRPEEMFSIRRQLTTIGRSLDNDVVIPEPEVSRYHARIEYVNGHLEIVDLESTNGTIVNGTQVRRRAIEQGDSVVVGNAKLELLPYRGAVPQGTQGRPR